MMGWDSFNLSLVGWIENTTQSDPWTLPSTWSSAISTEFGEIFAIALPLSTVTGFYWIRPTPDSNPIFPIRLPQWSVVGLEFSIQSDWVEKFLRLGTNLTHGDPYLVSSTSHNHDDCVILVMELEELYENPIANFQIGFICCNFDRTIYYCSLSAIFWPRKLLCFVFSNI